MREQEPGGDPDVDPQPDGGPEDGLELEPVVALPVPRDPPPPPGYVDPLRESDLLDDTVPVEHRAG